MNRKGRERLSRQMTPPLSPSPSLSALAGAPPDQTPVPARAPRRRLAVPARWYGLPLALFAILGLVLVGTGRLDEKSVSNPSGFGSQLLALTPSLLTSTPVPTQPPDDAIAHRPLPTPYDCSSMTNYYIEQNGGSDSYDGRADIWNGTHGPWKTISHATDVLSGGAKCVNVGPGTYTGEIYTAQSGSTDTPTGYFVWRSLKPHQAILQEPTHPKITAVFYCDSCKYVVIDGFTINGNLDGIEQGIAFFGSSGGYHIKILNNVVANMGDDGISVYAPADSNARSPYGYDYVTIAGNVVHDVGQSGADPGASDGIETFHQVTLDSHPGFHSMIYNNVVYNVGYPRHPTQKTENHCIMLDNLGGQHIPYTSPVFVENNLLYNCSGNGINVYGQFNSTIRNNTLYANCRSATLGYSCGEIFVVMDNRQGATIVNNIADTAGLTTRFGHYALVECTRSGADINTWYNNLTFNGTTGQPSVSYTCGGTQTPITAVHGNILGQNPQFHNPSRDDFTLQSTSPAIGRGTGLYPGDPFVDSINLAGAGRSQGKNCNIGAY